MYVVKKDLVNNITKMALFYKEASTGGGHFFVPLWAYKDTACSFDLTSGFAPKSRGLVPIEDRMILP